MEHILFRSKFQLWDHMQHLCDGVDLNATLRLPLFWFRMEDGVEYKNGSAAEFAKCANKVFDLNLNPKLSYRSGKSCVMFFNDAEDKPVDDSATVENTLLISLESDSEGVVTDSEKPLEKVFIDWEWINSLKSTQKDKKRFDEYSQEKLNIDLNRGRKICDMIEEFKDAAASKGIDLGLDE